MTAEQIRLVEDLFHELSTLPPEQHAQALKASNHDTIVLETVRRMLAHVGAAEDFRDPVYASQVGHRVDADGTQSEPPRAPAARDSDAIDQSFGPYRLLSVLGEGGMGSVYLAEQREPVRRRVAFKIIKLGMDTRQVIARFEAERQALALMNHPNIARVFDAGATAQGRPYFVMEHVPGIAITAHCEQYGLGLRDRLELFQDVCAAIQHAHQKGVIHRDIKSSNVLVVSAGPESARGASPVQRRGIAKVIDFGVAKATAARLTEKTVFTEFGQFIGTPAYMSPEQASPTVSDIDTRTDIYSLGVLLYELLTGTLPLDPPTLRAGGFEELQRMIREVDPPRPSMRLSVRSTADARKGRPSGAAGFTGLRRDDSRTLIRSIRGDLDWIVMKCLEKDRTRRYQTVAELAADIDRHLRYEPVSAGPPTARYRARRFVRRHRGAVASAALIVVALSAATIVSVVSAQSEARQRAEAESHRRAAEQARDRAIAMKDFLVRALRTQDPEQFGRQEITVSEAMQQAVAMLDKSELSGQPHIVAELLDEIANILLHAGRIAEAEPLARRALRMWKRQHLGDHWHLAAGQNLLARCMLANGRAANALPIFEASLAMYQRLLRGDHPAIANALSGRAACLDKLGRSAEALPLHMAALEMHRRMTGDDDVSVATGFNEVALCVDQLGRTGDALAHYEKALEISQRLRHDDNPQLAIYLNNVGHCLQRLGRPSEALPKCEAALEMLRRLYEGDHPYIATTLRNVAGCLYMLGRAAEALPNFESSLAMQKRLSPGDHHDLARGLSDLGLCLQSLGRASEALPMHEAALAIRQRLFPGDHPDTANSLNDLASCLQLLGRTDEAVVRAKAALAICRRLYSGDSPGLATSLNNLAYCLKAAGQAAEATREFEEAAAIFERLFPQGHPHLFTTLRNLAECLDTVGRFDEALSRHEAALAMHRQFFKRDSLDRAAELMSIACCLASLGRAGEATAKCRSALAIERRLARDAAAHAYFAGYLALRGERLLRCNAADAAILVLRECENVWCRLLPEGHWRIANARSLLGEAVLTSAITRFSMDPSGNSHATNAEARTSASSTKEWPETVAGLREAEQLLTGAQRDLLSRWEDIPADVRPSHLCEATVRLVRLYEAWDAAEPGAGHDVTAGEWRKQLDQLPAH